MPRITNATYSLGKTSHSNRIYMFQKNNPIVSSINSISSTTPPPVGIFCSDLDGTLVKGDVTEGSIYFKGITEHLYDLHLAKTDKYQTYHDYSTEYFRRWDKFDTSCLAMPYEVYDYSRDVETKQAIADYWVSTIQHNFVIDTKNLLQAKANAGNNIWIVSASPRIYIEPIITILPFIQKIVAVEPDESSHVISYGAGKVTRLKKANNNSLNGVVGFTGDTWNGDGPLMSAIKNFYSLADVKFIDHFGSLSTDTIQNLSAYNIHRLKTFVY